MKNAITLLIMVVVINISGINHVIYADGIQHTDKPSSIEKQIENKSYKVESFNSLPNKEITFLEAYKLGLEQAKEYDENVELIFLNSVDDKKVSGQNGKKGNWQGVLALPSINRHMVYVVEKGKLKNYRIIDSSDELSIKDSEIKTDSSQIVKSAIKQFNLQPSPKDHSFSHGYHFRIIRDEKHIFLAVDGQVNGQRI